MNRPYSRRPASGGAGGSGGGGDDGDGGDEDEDDNQGRKVNPAKAASKIWKSFKPFRGKIKTNGLNGKNQRYYDWDYTHNDIEVYDSNFKHIGSMHPKTGKIYKDPVPGRRLEL